MIEGYTWQCPAELLTLLDDLAAECDRTREEMLPMMLLNGLLCTVSLGVRTGVSANHDLLRRIQAALDALPTDAPQFGQVFNLSPTVN